MSSLSRLRGDFWRGVEETFSGYKPEEPVVIRGRTVCDKAKELQKKMFSSCNKSEEYVKIFLRTLPELPKRVLDLGCGIGSNTRWMTKSGAHVTGIDSDGDLLDQYLKICRRKECPIENVRLRLCDITRLESYGENFELVVAVDILPYVEPTSLKSVMEKIRNCMANGAILIGTIFTTDDGGDSSAMELTCKLGGHYYLGGKDFVSELLSRSGFLLNEVRLRPEGGVSFIASKQ